MRVAVAVVVLLLHSITGVFSQSVFDPGSFTQASCSGNYDWTTWFDSSSPNIAQGEFEVTVNIQQKFPSFMCPSPVAIEVSRTTKREASMQAEFSLRPKQALVEIRPVRVMSFEWRTRMVSCVWISRSMDSKRSYVRTTKCATVVWEVPLAKRFHLRQHDHFQQ